MSYQSKITRLENAREDRLQRDRENFHTWLKTLPREQKQQFFERALSAGLLPPWSYSEPLFSLPASDERVIAWMDRLRKFQIDPVAADSATLRLFRKFAAP